MSVQDQQKTLENLNKEIEEKERILSGLKIDITSRHKLLETLNNIDKSSDSQALVRTIKRQEEELNNRDEQIKSLYERLEEAEKALRRKDSERNQAGSIEELQKAWEAQKVKYVEDIQKITIELKKKDRLMEEKCKAYDDTIAELNNNIHNLEAKIVEQTKQITELEGQNKQKSEELELVKEKSESVEKELAILGDSNKKLREAYDKNEEELRVSREERLKTEEAINSKNELDAKEKEEKEGEVLHLQKENKAMSLELATYKKNNETLLHTQNEKEEKIAKLNEELTQAEEKLRTVTQNLEKEKKAHQAQADLLQELMNSENEKNKAAQETARKEEEKYKELASKAHKAEELEKENETLRRSGTTFENKLEAVRLENEAEMRKLTRLLQDAEADKKEKGSALEEKELRLQELEEINGTFESLVQGLKKTILDVQERLEKNGRYLLDLQRKLKAKEVELEVYKTAAETKINAVAKAKDEEMKNLVVERADQEERIAKLEKNLLQMMDEATMYKQKYKVTTDRLAALSRKSNNVNPNILAQKDTEINILKEMLKASQGVIRTKDLEITKIKQRGSPLKLPKINGGHDMHASNHGPISKYGNHQYASSGAPSVHGNYYRGSYDQRSLHDSESNFSHHDLRAKFGNDGLLEKLMENLETPNKKGMENYMSEIQQRIERENLKYRHDRGASTDREPTMEDLARTHDNKIRTKKNNGNIFDPTADADQDNLKSMGVSPVKVAKKKQLPPIDSKLTIQKTSSQEKVDEDEYNKKSKRDDKKKPSQQPKQIKKSEEDEDEEAEEEEEEEQEEQEEEQEEENEEEEAEELSEREEIEA